MLKKNKTLVEIAIVLERSKSTISREIERNSVFDKKLNKRIYITKKADHKAYIKQY
jgi:IS30 family transposase